MSRRNRRLRIPSLRRRADTCMSHRCSSPALRGRFHSGPHSYRRHMPCPRTQAGRCRHPSGPYPHPGQYRHQCPLPCLPLCLPQRPRPRPLRRRSRKNHRLDRIRTPQEPRPTTWTRQPGRALFSSSFLMLDSCHLYTLKVRGTTKTADRVAGRREASRGSPVPDGWTRVRWRRTREGSRPMSSMGDGNSCPPSRVRLVVTEWVEVLHDPDLAAAILDRVLHRGRLLILDGQSIRNQKPLTGPKAGDPSAIFSGTSVPDLLHGSPAKSSAPNTRYRAPRLIPISRFGASIRLFHLRATKYRGPVSKVSSIRHRGRRPAVDSGLLQSDSRAGHDHLKPGGRSRRGTDVVLFAVERRLQGGRMWWTEGR